MSYDGTWIGIAGNSPTLFCRRENEYSALFLEADNDRVDEVVFDRGARWALTFSSTDWRSWVSLWYLEGGQPNIEKIRIQGTEGFNIAGRQMSVRFGRRHIFVADEEAVIVIGNECFRIPLIFAEWQSGAFEMVGRNLSEKEVRELFGTRDIRPLRPDWERPLSVEAWEGTH